MERTEVVHDILVEGLDDWVSVIAVVRYAMECESHHYKELTSSVLGELLEGGLVVAGDLGESGFEVWPGSPHNHLQRALQELDDSDWDPPNGGFWLASTDIGLARARTMQAKDSAASG